MISKTILGVDPGMKNTGWAVVKRDENGKYRLKDIGMARFPNGTDGERYLYLSELMGGIVKDFDVDGISVERVFFGKNVTSCLSTAEVIGVLSLTGALMGVPVVRLTPQQVKSVGGHGKVGKRQLARVVSKLLSIPSDTNLTHHETDAAAVAISGILHGAGACPPRSPEGVISFRAWHSP